MRTVLLIFYYIMRHIWNTLHKIYNRIDRTSDRIYILGWQTCRLTPHYMRGLQVRPPWTVLRSILLWYLGASSEAPLNCSVFHIADMFGGFKWGPFELFRVPYCREEASRASYILGFKNNILSLQNKNKNLYLHIIFDTY